MNLRKVLFNVAVAAICLLVGTIVSGDYTEVIEALIFASLWTLLLVSYTIIGAFIVGISFLAYCLFRRFVLKKGIASVA